MEQNYHRSNQTPKLLKVYSLNFTLILVFIMQHFYVTYVKTIYQLAFNFS